MKTLTVGCTLVFCLVLGNSACVLADFLNNDFGLSAPDQTIEFDEFGIPPFTVVTNQYSSLGVNFAPNLFQSPQGGDLIENIDDFNLGNFDASSLVVDPYSIEFTSNVTSAAFAMATNPGDSTFTALLDGMVLESFTVKTTFDDPINFYGFENIVFDEIQVDVGGVNDSMLLDNLQFTVVPEPGSMAILSLLATGVFRRRRTL